jgi:hypothetical protein
MKITKAAFVCALLALASRAEAQRNDQFVWGIAGGPTFVVNEAADNHKTGAHGQLMFGIGAVDSPFGVRLDAFYTSLGDKDGNAPVDQGSARVFALMGTGVFNIYGSNRRLYGVVGLGGHWYNPDGSGTNSKNDLVLHAGLGAWLPAINGFVEAKFMNLYRALPDPDSGLPGKKSAQLIPVTLGIMF